MPAASTEEPASRGAGQWVGRLLGAFAARVRREPWLAAFLVLAVASIVPLCVTRYLPFCDLNGAEGLLGAWRKASDPRARIAESFDINIRPLPNALFYALCRPLLAVFSAPVAANIYVALFCILALPVALLYALHSFGKPKALALLGFAMAYHRCMWFGFVGSVTAVPLMLLSWGLANRAFVAPRWTKEHTLLALTVVLLAMAHGFLVLVGVSLLGAWVILAAGPWRRWLRNGLTLAPGLLYLAPWLSSAGERSGSTGSFVGQLWARSDPRAALGRSVEWFIDGYAGHLDEGVAAVFALTLLVLLAAGARRAPRADSASSTLPEEKEPVPWRLRLPFTALCLGAGYLLLPMSISKPLDWWAVHVRLLVPFVLVVVLLIPTRRRGLPTSVLAPVALASGLYFAYMAYDFRAWYRGVETQGFDEVVAALPDAPHVLMLWPDFTAERHYAHFPMSHLGTLVLDQKGGRVSPVHGTLPKDMWIAAKPEPPGPGWGLARAFRWDRHAAYWDFFLVKQPAPGNGFFPIAWPGAFPVERVAASGLWSLWRKR